MIPALRARWNEQNTEAGYRAYVHALTERVGCQVEFRICETPCFYPQALMDSLVGASEVMVSQLLGNAACRKAADAIVPDRFRLAGGEQFPTCVQVDFGLVRQPDGAIEGRLVELQAFPSLYGFQMALAELVQEKVSGAFFKGTRHLLIQAIVVKNPTFVAESTQVSATIGGSCTAQLATAGRFTLKNRLERVVLKPAVG